MSSDFDKAAISYDEEFTNSHIGKMQRKRVWEFLDKVLDEKENISVLELNCGTGEDARRFALRGHEVIATDLSEKMLELAKSKANKANIDFRRLDLNEIQSFDFNKTFDLIFSNFGGLNCIDSWSVALLGQRIPKLLNSEGVFVAVIMPQACVWESMYYLLKGKVGEAFRRRKEFAMANVSGEQVKTFYYSPRKFSKLLSESLKVDILKPIGLFIPPSYMEKFFRKRLRLLKALFKSEKLFASLGWQAFISDHYYIQFSIK